MNSKGEAAALQHTTNPATPSCSDGAAKGTTNVMINDATTKDRTNSHVEDSVREERNNGEPTPPNNNDTIRLLNDDTSDVTNDVIHVSSDATQTRKTDESGDGEAGSLRLKRNLAVTDDITNVSNDETHVTKDVTENRQQDESGDEEDGSLRLKRNLGLLPAVSYVAGGIIGVGIFVSPQTVLLNVGGSVGVSLCVWVFCALVAFSGALVYAELGTRIRKSGGTYTYVRAAWGDGAGFLMLWTQQIVVRPMATALGAMTAAEYALRPVFLQCPHMVPRGAKVLLALCFLGFIVFLSSYDTRLGAVLQALSTMCKLSALAVIIVIGIVFLGTQGGSENFEDLFSAQELTAAGLVFAMYSCNYAYMGWDHLNMATEEVKNPQRNVPLAIMLGISLTTVVYLLAVVSYHAVLTTTQITSGLAVVAVFIEVTVPPLMYVIVPCIAISAVGIVNVIIFTATRIMFIGGRDGLFPEVLSMVHVTRKTPLVSCLVLGLATGVVILMGDVRSVLGAYSLFRASGETIAILGLLRLRRKFPASRHTYVVPTVIPAFFLVVHLSLAAVAITRDTSRYIIPLILTLAGIPLYLLSTSPVFTKGPLKRFNEFSIEISRKLLHCDLASKSY